jgi:hypothetical protein
MPGTNINRQYDALLTTTLDNYRETLIDNIFDDYPLLSWLNGKLGMAMRGTSVKRIVDGGVTIIEHLMYGLNSTVDSYSGAGIIDTTLQEGMTVAQYAWKQYAGTIGITGLEKRNNQGRARMINLLEAKTRQLVNSLRDRLSRDAYSDGTGNGGKNLGGLGLLVESSSTTIGGITLSSNSWWTPIEGTAASFAANGLDTMRTVFNTCSYGNDKPDAIFTDQTNYERYEKALQPQERYVNTKAANSGFTNLTFKGVPVFFDRDCTSNTFYFLNSKYLNLVVHRDADFATSPFVSPENQDITTAKMIFQGNLTSNNLRMLGKTNVTAA